MKRLSKKLSILLVLAICMTMMLAFTTAFAAPSNRLADRPFLERPVSLSLEKEIDEWMSSNLNPVRYNALGVSCAVYWDIDPNTGTYRDPINGYTIRNLNPLTQGVISIPPYDCFVVEIRTAEAGSFDMRYGDWRDDYYGTVRLYSLGTGRTFSVSGVTYTEQIFWRGYAVFSDERPYFKAVSRPVGWQNPNSDGIMNWLQMY